MPGKREQRKILIRKAILEATIEVLIEKGYDRTSLNEIAGRAGITKRTLYKYFPSKIVLYCETVDHHLQALHRRLSKTLERELPTDEKLLQLVNDLIAFFVENEPFVRQFTAFNIHQFEGIAISELVDRVSLLQESIIKEIAEVVKKGQQEGVIIEHDPELLVHLVVAICKGIYSHASTEDKLLNVSISPDDLFGTLFQVLTKDVIKQTRKGLKFQLAKADGASKKGAAKAPNKSPGRRKKKAGHKKNRTEDSR